MRRIRIIGACLVAAFALSASVTSSAIAGEYGQCKNTSPATGKAIKKGLYKDANCQGKESVVDPDGQFEWYPGPSPSCVGHKKGEYTESGCKTKSTKPKKGKFEIPCLPAINCATYTSTTGEVVFSTAFVTVKCTGSTDLGEITGLKTDVDTITFMGCETIEGKKCTSLEGATIEGEVVSYKLETTLIDSGEKGPGGKEPAKGEVWAEFSNVHLPHAPYLAEAFCVGYGYARVSGNASGVQTGDINMMSSTSKEVFGSGKGEQNLITELCDKADCSGGVIGPLATIWTFEGSTKGAEEGEIKA
jgi:hypothetical protein